jgi:hypothetical protein
MAGMETGNRIQSKTRCDDWEKIMQSVVFAPPKQVGGVKSLYAVCEWLDRLGISRIRPFGPSLELADWFEHRCSLFDHSYEPDLVVYPEVCQPDLGRQVFHVCFALGKHEPIRPNADLVVCRSLEVEDWVQSHAPQLKTKFIAPSIRRREFEYDGRPKQKQICYFTRSDKYPETAQNLRERYGDSVVEIQGRTEREVGGILKSAKVLLWRGNDKEGSPRPPKEGLVAGCVVVGLECDLHERLGTSLGIKCRSVDELLTTAGTALRAPIPSVTERAVVRDDDEERKDWERLIKQLSLPSKAISKQSA